MDVLQACYGDVDSSEDSSNADVPPGCLQVDSAVADTAHSRSVENIHTVCTESRHDMEALQDDICSVHTACTVRSELISKHVFSQEDATGDSEASTQFHSGRTECTDCRNQEAVVKVNEKVDFSKRKLGPEIKFNDDNLKRLRVGGREGGQEKEYFECIGKEKVGFSELGLPGCALQVSEGVEKKTSVKLPSPDVIFNSIPGVREEAGHQGRIRSFPHVAGNFAVHVYIPVEVKPSIRAQLSPFLSLALKFFPSLHPMEDTGMGSPAHSQRSGQRQSTEVKQGQSGSKVPLAVSQEYHISLSKPTAIRFYQIESILEVLRRKLHYQKGFEVQFDVWETFVNEDKTRSFLALEIVKTGLSELSKMISIVDEAFSSHDLPAFYRNPRPHISVAWALGDVTTELTSLCEQFNVSVKEQVHTLGTENIGSAPPSKSFCLPTGSYSSSRKLFLGHEPSLKNQTFLGSNTLSKSKTLLSNEPLLNTTESGSAGSLDSGRFTWRTLVKQTNCKIGKMVHTVWNARK